MKDASTSCRALYEMVRRSQNFREIAKLCLNHENLARSQYFFRPGMAKSVDSGLPLSKRKTIEKRYSSLERFLGFGVIEANVAVSKNILIILQRNSDFLRNVHTVSIINNSKKEIIPEVVPMLHFIFVNTSLVTLKVRRGRIEFNNLM